MSGGKPMEFALDDGKVVSLEALYYTHTYAGLLEGYPDATYNNKVVQQAISRTTKIWGPRATYLVPPKSNEKGFQPHPRSLRREHPPHVELPGIEIQGWFTSDPPVQSGEYSTELVIIWYRDQWQEESLYSVVYDGIRSVRWIEFATEFEP